MSKPTTLEKIQAVSRGVSSALFAAFTFWLLYRLVIYLSTWGVCP